MLASPGFIVAGFVRLPGEVCVKEYAHHAHLTGCTSFQIYQAGSVVEAHNNMIAKGPMWQVW
jgi:hypothetical protein